MRARGNVNTVFYSKRKRAWKEIFGSNRVNTNGKENIMQRLEEGIATVTKRVIFSDENAYIPISITIGDNCCDEHARLQAESIIKIFAENLSREENCVVLVEADSDDV
jgi:hypothetical protein